MWDRWALGADDVVWSFFGAKPLKHHTIALGQKNHQLKLHMVGTYARTKCYKIAAGINVSYISQNRPPMNEHFSAKNPRL